MYGGFPPVAFNTMEAENLENQKPDSRNSLISVSYAIWVIRQFDQNDVTANHQRHLLPQTRYNLPCRFSVRLIRVLSFWRT